MICLLLLIPVVYLWLIAPHIGCRKQMRTFCGLDFAHRGYWDMEKGIPENSMAAFRAALKKGVGIELDVHLTKDNRIVVFHDDTLTRLCGKPGTVESMTCEELQQCYLCRTSERIPLFSDVLKLVDGRVPLLIELKLPSKDTALCPLLYRELSGYRGNYLIQSFNSLGVLWFRRHAPHVLRGQLSSNLTKSDPDKPFLLCFSVRYLLTNALTRPDFISYKLKDRKNLSLFFHRCLFRTPIAVWTLRTEEDFLFGKNHFSMAIFEKF